MNNNSIGPTAHHELSPSKFPAWAACAKFDSDQDLEDADVEALTPEAEKVDGSAKARGTAQHKALAKVLTGQPKPFEGLSEREEKQVRWTAETVVDIAASMGYSPEEIRVEQRITLLGPDFKVMYFGTPDAEFGHVIVDAKFGDEREYIAQMAGYALPKMDRDELDRIHVKIVYGRLRRVRTHVLDRRTAETIVYSVLNRRGSPYSRPVPCEYCGWCKHITSCEALVPNIAAIVDKREDWPMKIPTAHISEAAGDPVVAGALRFLWKAYIEPWGAGVEYLTSGMAKNGVKPLGFRIQPEKGRGAFTSSKAVADAMLRAGVTPEILADAASFSMEGLAKAYVAQFGGSKEAAAANVEKILTQAGVMSRGEPTTKLVREKNGAELLALALARKTAPVLTGN